MSVHSQKDWDFVKNTVLSGAKSNIWIGGYQTKGEKVWKWDDDSSFDWTNWDVDNGNGANCQYMYLWKNERYEWADAPCSFDASYPFLCKI